MLSLSLVIIIILAVVLIGFRQKNQQLQKRLNELTHISDEQIQGQVNTQVKAVLDQDKLLQIVNETASLLLGSSVEGFDLALYESMGMIARCVDVDRMYIWKNSIKDGRLHCGQVYEWSEDAEPQQGNELTVDILYDEVVPGWEQTLSAGRSVKGLVKNLSEAEQRQLSPQGIISILVVPVYMRDEFWGFVGFDDCEEEREFTDAEEGILRSASLLIATSLLRNEITLSLIEAKMVSDQSAQAKSDFLSNMSHEIRTPINAITGMTLLAQKSNDMARVKDCLNKIDGASRQLLGLINDILDMSKISAGKMDLVEETFNVEAMLHNVKSIISVRIEEKGQHLKLIEDPAVPKMLVGDEMRLSQILLNLLTNAVKFTETNGNITLQAKLVTQEQNKCQMQFQVIDDGIGINEEQQERLFQAFEQAERTTTKKYGGTGLGLAISRQLAELMNGDITVESTLGQGSCFTTTVWLTLADEAQQAAEAKKDETRQAKLGDLTGKRILLVEDIAINREIVISLLKETHVSIDWAENGKEAVDMFQAAPDQYDLILMDISMPVMDGFDATKHIRALGSAAATEVPILAMTANAFDEDIRQCLEAGMNSHIAKPIDVQAMFTEIAHHLT